ncbi:hypothetical protein DESPIG_02919 [Desulfovibrio piger ATCC 29098]|uniref:Uncharacterized protein n=1 Tax=Desulfovibrio piger ATCC 29098 TaxID=411464 RepID=B6WXT9_9BACT|nr:hypothetical protein DESPIG_02919 [Desulfovibrio piger ATCC 29098]
MEGLLVPFHNIQTNCRNFLLHIDFIFSKTNFIYQKITFDIKYKANCISTVNYSSWTGKFPDFLLQNFHSLTQSFFSGIMPQSFCLAFQAIPVVQP